MRRSFDERISERERSPDVDAPAPVRDAKGSLAPAPPPARCPKCGRRTWRPDGAETCVRCEAFG